jgi:hypothetical protein
MKEAERRNENKSKKYHSIPQKKRIELNDNKERHLSPGHLPT